MRTSVAWRIAVDVIVGERGQVTLPKPVRDALGLAKGSVLKVELDGGRIVLRKDASEALRKVRGKFRLADGLASTDAAMRELRGRAPLDGDDQGDRG